MASLSAVPAPRAEAHNFGLDVARFTAVALVLVTHCTVLFLSLTSFRPPVFVDLSAVFGVELFFVLSGFLIGRLLFRIAETDPTPRGWLIFMARRWLRTLPLYFLWLAVLPSVLPAPPELPAHLLRYATMMQNLAWPMPADHWFNESWSLSIEEWFYLLFSAALLAAVALARNTRAIWPVIGAFILVPAALRLLLPAHGAMPPQAYHNEHVYHVALFRLDAIAYGVALARLHVQGSRLFNHPRLAFCLGAAIVLGFWEQDSYGQWFAWSRMTFLDIQLVAASIGLCLMLVGLLRLRPTFRPLAWVIGTGASVSYGIYIMHLTILVWVMGQAARYGWGLAFVMPVSLVLIAVLPYLSFRFFETPILALRPRQAHPAARRDEGVPVPHPARP